MKNKGALIKELCKNISTTGAVTFSSKPLVKKMLSYANFSGSKLIVELGGGDGSITQGIIERMDPDATLLVFEISESFCNSMSNMFPQENVHIICDSAENMDKYLDGNKADLIFSSLPLTLIPKDVRSNIYLKCKEWVDPNGQFIQICYSYLLKYQFAKHFTDIQSYFVIRNFPPTFILVCR